MIMENLSLKAAKLAQRDLTNQFPQLANKEVRKKLSEEEKLWVFNQLHFLAEFYEAQLISEVQWRYV